MNQSKKNKQRRNRIRKRPEKMRLVEKARDSSSNFSITYIMKMRKRTKNSAIERRGSSRSVRQRTRTCVRKY